MKSSGLCEDEADDKSRAKSTLMGRPPRRATPHAGLALWRNRRSFLPPRNRAIDAMRPHLGFVVDRAAYTIGFQEKLWFLLVGPTEPGNRHSPQGVLRPVGGTTLRGGKNDLSGSNAYSVAEALLPRGQWLVFTTLSHPRMCPPSPYLARMNNGTE
jgi:hypothetical protein